MCGGKWRRHVTLPLYVPNAGAICRRLKTDLQVLGEVAGRDNRLWPLFRNNRETGGLPAML